MTTICQTENFLAGLAVMGSLSEKSPRVGASAAGGVPREGDTAAHQRRTRQAHAMERAQDYVEAIADLIEDAGEARATDLARLLGVTHVTVVRTVQRLQREGLVVSRPYRSIFLTDTGRKMAAKAKARHSTVVAFLRSLGISAETARADAEGIEHHVSPETLAAFERYLDGQSTPGELPRSTASKKRR